MAFHKIDVVGGEIDQVYGKLMVYCFSPYRGLKQ